MSDGTPPFGAGFMRHRHSQEYASSGDDLEDDACSRLSYPSSPPSPRKRSWIEVLENFLWLISSIFIAYYGDSHFNLIYLLWHDERIRRRPLYLGMVGIGLNMLIFVYTSMLAWNDRRFDEKWELTSMSALPIVTLLGLISFCFLSFALWPIWSFLTLPLLFTLFMASMVILPCFMLGTFRPQYNELRRD